jgi:hypothetical protein
MKRDEVEIALAKRGFWKPYEVSVTLPAGLSITGRGWTPNKAFQAAIRTGQKLLGIFKDEVDE